MQRCVAAIAPRMDICASMDKCLDCFSIAIPCRQMQGCDVAIALRVDVCASSDEFQNRFSITVPCRLVQRRQATGPIFVRFRASRVYPYMMLRRFGGYIPVQIKVDEFQTVSFDRRSQFSFE